MRALPLLVLVLCLGGASGCASLFNSSPGDLSVNSVPSGADVSIDDLETSCQTPCEMEVKPGRYELHIKKAGYRTEEVKLVKRMSAWFWINFLEGPGVLLGMGIDALTGSIFRLSPKDVNVKLVPLNAEKAQELKKEEEKKAKEENTPVDEPDDQAAVPDRPAISGDNTAPAPAAAPVEEAPPLPPTAEVKRLKEAVPEATLDREVTNYYGSVDGKKREMIKRRLYNILLQQVRDGQTPDIDDAIKTEHFRYQN